MKGRNKGFTLIELLVVIAIIGILASVVLASLNSARAKGKDASAIESMSSIRAQAELYYNGAGANSYGAAGATGNMCDDTGTTGGTPVTDLLAAAGKQTGGTAGTCSVGQTKGTYEAHITLNSGDVFCVDDSGQATTSPQAVGWLGTAGDGTHDATCG